MFMYHMDVCYATHTTVESVDYDVSASDIMSMSKLATGVKLRVWKTVIIKVCL